MREVFQWLVEVNSLTDYKSNVVILWKYYETAKYAKVLGKSYESQSPTIRTNYITFYVTMENGAKKAA